MSQEEIKLILNGLQERLKARNNRLTIKGIRVVTKFLHASFKDINYEILRKITKLGFGIFANAWYL